MTLMLKIVGFKAYQAWKRIPPAQRKAILRAAQTSAKKHGPTVARTVRDRGPVVAKRLSEAIRESRKKRQRRLRRSWSRRARGEGRGSGELLPDRARLRRSPAQNDRRAFFGKP